VLPDTHRRTKLIELFFSLYSKLAVDRKQTDILEQYWAANGAHDLASPQLLDDNTHSLRSPSISFKTSQTKLGKGHSRHRSASDGAALIPAGQGLSPFHPAWSLTALLETFGPLIFPIYRAALLRKRILISTHAPVHEVCNFGTLIEYVFKPNKKQGLTA